MLFPKKYTDVTNNDDTDSFGMYLLRINLRNHTDQVVTKAELRIGDTVKQFINPVFPLQVNLTRYESQLLKQKNCAYLAVWDANNKKRTCNQKAIITSRSKKV